MTAEDIKLLNCASCRRELLGDSPGNVSHGLALLGTDAPPIVAGRVDGRPYCSRCLRFIEQEAQREALRSLRS